MRSAEIERERDRQTDRTRRKRAERWSEEKIMGEMELNKG